MEFLIGIGLLFLLLPIDFALVVLSRKNLRISTQIVLIKFLVNMFITVFYTLGVMYTIDDIIPFIIGICLSIFLNMISAILYVLVYEPQEDKLNKIIKQNV